MTAIFVCTTVSFSDKVEPVFRDHLSLETTYNTETSSISQSRHLAVASLSALYRAPKFTVSPCPGGVSEWPVMCLPMSQHYTCALASDQPDPVKTAELGWWPAPCRWWSRGQCSGSSHMESPHRVLGTPEQAVRHKCPYIHICTQVPNRSHCPACISM